MSLSADAVVSTMPDRVGKHLIVGKLASGGMATTYLARLVGPAGFENVVVVKRMLPHLAEDARFRVMFEDEARTVARIRHPNVVRIFELVSEVGELYLVMEYLEGDTLNHLLRGILKRGDRLPWELACFIASEAAIGLHAAHEQTDDEGRLLGVVHRDVSPHNLFLTADGGVKVIDFGIAKSADHVSTTSTGELKGKFAYMSPEQVESRPVDRRSDVFALGVVLWELLAHRRLFARDTQMATMRAVANDAAPRLSTVTEGVPPALDELLARALAKDPAERVPDMLELRRVLLEAIKTTGMVDPKAELATLTGRAFAPALSERTELIRRSRGASTGVSSIPEIAEGPAMEGTPSRVRPASAVIVAPPSERAEPLGRWAMIAAALVAVLIVGGGVGWLVAAPGATPSATPSASPSEPVPAAQAPAPTPPPTASPAAPAPTAVMVSFESEPSGALVALDGITRGNTPLSLELPIGTTPITLAFSQAGHRSVEMRFIADRAQTLRASLPRAGSASPSSGSVGMRQGSTQAGSTQAGSTQAGSRQAGIMQASQGTMEGASGERGGFYAFE